MSRASRWSARGLTRGPEVLKTRSSKFSLDRDRPSHRRRKDAKENLGMSIRFSDFSRDLVLIAGPCVIESEEHVQFMARAIREAVGPETTFVFKASFDKANRTSVSGYRGPGLVEGLRILAGVRAAGFSVLTDIHEPGQAERAAEAADILQIPAFLCRQTDLLLAAGRTGRIVNIKKGQFVAPHDIA